VLDQRRRELGGVPGAHGVHDALVVGDGGRLVLVREHVQVRRDDDVDVPEGGRELADEVVAERREEQGVEGPVGLDEAVALPWKSSSGLSSPRKARLSTSADRLSRPT
jgi:hypothetical protein